MNDERRNTGGMNVKNLICFAILALAAMAHADTLTFVSTGSNTAGNVYTYPYYFSIDGSQTLTPLMCLSYNNEITVGESWAVTVQPITTTPERQAAWLYADAQENPGNDAADNLAAWRLFAGNVPMTDAADVQLALAEADYGTVNAADFTLYVPLEGFNTPGAPQTFIGSSVAPEPVGLWLEGMMFLALVVGAKRLQRCRVRN